MRSHNNTGVGVSPDIAQGSDVLRMTICFVFVSC